MQRSRKIQPVVRGKISLYAARYKTFQKKIINEWRYLPCFKSRNNMFKLVNSHLINLQKKDIPFLFNINVRYRLPQSDK